jgi:pyruvate/2-oxoglutarate dehydrogenase complex dihydrolipoamide dehydrogenase (E3) component
LSSVITQLLYGRVFDFDKAFVALGRVANIDSLGLAGAGLEASGRGLLTVNEVCQRAIPHTYAVGDTIGPPALASASMDQGRRAVVHALSGVRSQTSPSLPTGIYTTPEIATVGMTEHEARQKIRCSQNRHGEVRTDRPRTHHGKSLRHFENGDMSRRPADPWYSDRCGRG